jgi:hypothetical protein
MLREDEFLVKKRSVLKRLKSVFPYTECICHSRNPALDTGASGIHLKNHQKDSGQAGMTEIDTL